MNCKYQIVNIVLTDYGSFINYHKLGLFVFCFVFSRKLIKTFNSLAVKSLGRLKQDPQVWCEGEKGLNNNPDPSMIKF